MQRNTAPRGRASLLRFFIFASLVIDIQPSTTAEASWADIPLLNRVIYADLIVVGRLGKIQENEILIDHADYGDSGEQRQFLFHTGTIVADSVLMNGYVQIIPPANNPQRPPAEFRFAFYSQYRPRLGGCYYDKTPMIPDFAEGQEGIWILNYAHLADHYAVTYPTNFMPIDSLQVVQQAIGEAIHRVGQ